MESQTTVLAQQLKAVPVFSDLAQEDLEWLASRMELAHYQPGEVVVEEGSPADRMIVVLEGEAQIQRERGFGDGRIYSAHAGQLTGMLPYSRLKQFPLTSRAMTAATVATLNVSHFPEMLKRLPALGGRLVGLMSDRIRETTRSDQQRDKLMALGKLSAGLAHELNNPAAAVRNAAVNLQQTISTLRSASLRLGQSTPSPENRVFLAQIECDWPKLHPPDGARFPASAATAKKRSATGWKTTASRMRANWRRTWWMPAARSIRCSAWRAVSAMPAWAMR